MAPRVALILLVALLTSGASAWCLAGVLLQSFGVRSVRKSTFANARRRVEVAVEAIGPLRRVKARTFDRRRADALRACMPEALRLLSSALSAGGSLVHALRYAAEHCDEPLAGELQRAVWDLEAGKSFSEAMESLRKRTGGSEFAYLAVAMDIQHVSGGSLGSAIEAVSESLQQTADLADELRTKTTQGRLSAKIVSAMPLILLVVLSLFSGNYVSEFFSSPVGVVMFVFALLLELLGILLVRRSLAIDLASGLGR